MYGKQVSMDRKAGLSSFEQGQVKTYKEEGYSSRGIARRLSRSPCVINNFLKLGNNYRVKKSTGKPKKLTPRQKRQVIRTLSAGGSSLGQLAQKRLESDIRQYHEIGNMINSLLEPQNRVRLPLLLNVFRTLGVKCEINLYARSDPTIENIAEELKHLPFTFHIGLKYSKFLHTSPCIQTLKVCIFTLFS
ncbi:hypothetical protein C0J52_20804 [Blattella germanica]|nr:hypothetical protein C0J52_20804 [Blattella germanica]